MKQTVVLFPGPGMGHLTPTVELAKLFTASGFAVVVVVETPHDPSSPVSSFIARVTQAHPSISFHLLPKVEALPPRANPHPLFSILDTVHATTALLSDFLKLFSQTNHIRALVLGLFCTDALNVASELHIPSYFFYASGASCLASFLVIPTLQSQSTARFRDLGDEPVHIPGLPPIPASHLVTPLIDPDEEMYNAFVQLMERLPMADGILVNSFKVLERRAFQALKEEIRVPGRRMPPIYGIGPVVADGANDGGEERHECLRWLDAQPKGSVVFLCFGSMWAFSGEQLVEIAVGLERSGQRFLWVVRSPPSRDPAKRFEPRPDPDLSVLMPEGFLERTEGRGMVVKRWAPQAEVLRHEALGGFVSHCGWNSTLEAVITGVPIIAWPLYAEQRMNKVFLVEEAKLAAEMKGYDKEMVRAEEVETKVRWLMESEGGRELKERAKAMKASATAAREEGGSSSAGWLKFVGTLNQGGNMFDE